MRSDGPRRAAACGALLCGLALPTQAAQWALGASAGLDRDDNVFRGSDDRVADNILQYGIHGSARAELGRQSLFVSAEGMDNRYARLRNLDAVTYGIESGVDWELAGDFAGTLRHSIRRERAEYGLAGAPETAERNLRRTRDWTFSTRRSIGSMTGLELGWFDRSIDYSADAYRVFDQQQRTASVAARFGTGGLFSVALAGRWTRGDTPAYEIAPGTYENDRTRRRDLDLLLDARTLRTTISLRFSHTDERHSQPSRPAYSGPTYAISASHQPGARIRFEASLARDVGNAVSEYAPLPIFAPIRIQTEQRSTIGQLAATYEATAKVDLALQGRWSRGRSGNGSFSWEDDLDAYAITAEYRPIRQWQLHCRLGHERRRATAPAIDSRATYGGCSTRVSWQ